MLPAPSQSPQLFALVDAAATAAAGDRARAGRLVWKAESERARLEVRK